MDSLRHRQIEPVA